MLSLTREATEMLKFIFNLSSFPPLNKKLRLQGS